MKYFDFCSRTKNNTLSSIYKSHLAHHIPRKWMIYDLNKHIYEYVYIVKFCFKFYYYHVIIVKQVSYLSA